MANTPLLDYKQLATRYYADLRNYSQKQIESDLYQDSDKVRTSDLKTASFNRLGEIVFGLEQGGHTDNAEALKKAIENVRKAVETYDKGEINGTEVLVCVAHVTEELKPLCRPQPAGTKAGQEKTMLRPTVKYISGIIKKLRALKKKQVAFVNAKYKVSDSDIDKIADRLNTARTSLIWQYAGSVEELIKKAAGLDVTLTELPLLEEIISDRPTKTLARAISALPMDELQKLLDKFLPELFQNTKTTADNKRHLHQIEKSISRELERKKKCKSDPAKLIEAMRKYELIGRKPKGYWPKAIQDLIDEIDKLLFPYLDYFKEKGTSGKWEQAFIEYLIKAGIPSYLDDVIHELKKIQHKMEIEAEQSAPKPPAGTKPPSCLYSKPVPEQLEGMDMQGFDVFLCHNSDDKSAVKKIGKALEGRGLKVWLDDWELRPGMPWQRALEKQIESIKSAAVFVGDSGIGPWQEMEMEAFLREFVKRGCPVIPVILKNSKRKPKLPVFLSGMGWVDFRKGPLKDGVDGLVWGITGKNAGRD